MKNLNSILKPIYYYVILLIIFFIFSDTLSEFDWIDVIVRLFMVILPLILLFWCLDLIYKKCKKISTSFLFTICAIPGFLFGVQFSYDGIGYISENNYISMIIAGLLFGIIFGAIGLLVNLIYKKKKFFPIKKIIIATTLGTVFSVGVVFLLLAQSLNNTYLQYIFLWTIGLPLRVITILTGNDFIAELVCGYDGRNTFGCLAHTLWLSPITYGTVFVLIYYYFLSKKDKAN